MVFEKVEKVSTTMHQLTESLKQSAGFKRGIFSSFPPSRSPSFSLTAPRLLRQPFAVQYFYVPAT